jgi:predicted helicase
MKHMIDGNCGLIVSRINRQISTGYEFITENISDFHVLDNLNDATYLFPLYLYEEVDFLGTIKMEKNPNIKSDILKCLKTKYNKPITPEQVLSYIYSVLHSPAYRVKYADFLKTDYPRIQFTDNIKVFEEMASLGWELMQTHMQKNRDLSKKYPGLGEYAIKGSNVVDKVTYNDTLKRLYINNIQYFGDITEEVSNFYIGGYQVLHKYLKGRKSRTLTLGEINNVEHIAKILMFTIDQMQKIDELTVEWI